jgi:hypothetical protein
MTSSVTSEVEAGGSFKPTSHTGQLHKMTVSKKATKIGMTTLKNYVGSFY